MKKYILILLLIFSCSVNDVLMAVSNPRLVRVRIANWGLEDKVIPNLNDFSWTAWLNGNKSETLTTHGTFEIAGQHIVTGQYMLVLEFNLQEFSNWSVGDILNLEVIYNDGGVIKTTSPWELLILANPSSTMVLYDESKCVVFPVRSSSTELFLYNRKSLQFNVTKGMEWK